MNFCLVIYYSVVIFWFKFREMRVIYYMYDQFMSIERNFGISWYDVQDFFGIEEWSFDWIFWCILWFFYIDYFYQFFCLLDGIKFIFGEVIRNVRYMVMYFCFI